jgi:intracellular multiplication protein IcmK
MAIASALGLSVTAAYAAPVGTDPSSQIVSPTANAVGNSATGMIKAAKDQSTPSHGIVLPVQPPAPPAGIDLTTNASDLAMQAEDAAKKAQSEADQAKTKREEEHNIKSFDRAEAGLLPMSNEQIRRFMRKVEDTQEASEAPSSGPPKGNVRIVNLQLDPGATPPQINLAANYVTTIDILDSTGAPWPILDVGIGGNFEVSPTPAGSHVVRIMPLARTGDGNLSVLLKDLPTPVIFRLSTGTTSVDLRAEVRVPKFGPNAKVPLVNRPPKLQAGDESILGILQNNPPGEAKRLKVSGLDARTMAWSLGEHTYVRTPLTLLSPAWSASVSSGDGMTVYEIGDAPVLLMSDNGAVVRTHISRDDDHDK